MIRLTKEQIINLHHDLICETGGLDGIKGNNLLESAGNKRTGTHVMLVFLAINGIELDYTQKDLYETILKVASNKYSYEELLKWVLNHQI